MQPDLSNLFQLAQRGEPMAIARFLNASLQPRGVTVKVLLREHCLKILLSSQRPLDQAAFVGYIQQQIDRLAVESITVVKIYSQQTSDGVTAWVQEFVPTAVSPSTHPSAPHPFLHPSASKAQTSKLDHKPDHRPDKSQTALVPFQANTLQVNTSPAPTPLTGRGTAASVKVKIVKIKTESQDFLAALRTFQLASVFPYRDVFSAELYRSSTVRLLLFLGLFPLIVNLIAEQVSLSQVAWLLGIYYASIWGIVLYNLIQPVQVSWSNVLKCIGFTTVIGIPLLVMFQHVPPFSLLYQSLGRGLFFRLAGFVLGVGVLEEICKALPVYLLFSHPQLLLAQPQKLPNPLTSAFYGAMSGLGFAIAEGATYSFFYASGLSRGQLDLSSYVVANTIRFVSLPLFHAILAGIVGYFIGLAMINPARQSAICFIGIAISATLHGVYNTFANGLPGLVIVGFSVLLFVAYLRRSQQMVDEVQQSERNDRKAGLD